jgi:hypothetical protein
MKEEMGETGSMLGKMRHEFLVGGPKRKDHSGGFK